MRNALRLTTALLAVMSTPAFAADTLPTLDPTPYLVGQAPESMGLDRSALVVAKQASVPVEREKSLNGTLYAVVAPTYRGDTESYIRLFNGAVGTSTFSITIVGSPSGRVYGTANIQIPSNASPQYSLDDIMTAALAGPPNGGDSSFALYIQNPDPTSGYQHVTYNNSNFFFENNSTCMNLLSPAIVTNSNAEVLTNVHTSVLGAYPSTITIANFWNAAVTYRLTIDDARTGARIGQMNLDAAANAIYTIPESSIEQTLAFTPTSSQEHINVFIVDASGASPSALSGVSITNSQLSAQINMSVACAVNAPATSTMIGGGGISGY